MKHLMMIIAVFFALPAFFIFAQDEYPSNSLPDYKQLANDCRSKPGKECCLSSLHEMEDNGFLLAPGETLRDSQCPPGFNPNTLKCPDSLIWCEPPIPVSPSD
jgi:hypothetical protein